MNYYRQQDPNQILAQVTSFAGQLMALGMAGMMCKSSANLHARSPAYTTRV